MLSRIFKYPCQRLQLKSNNFVKFKNSKNKKMLDNNTYWIEVFKTGSFTDANGTEFDCDINKLNEIASKYNEALTSNDTLKAPVVKGHPESNDPAFGWVKSLKVEGDTLFAELYDMDQSFVDEVKEKKYQKVSISLYDDLMLRHIGFLGAMPPAVKGMENVSFSEIEGKKITNYLYSFSAELNTEKDNVSETEIHNFNIQENAKYKRSKPDRFKEYRSDEFADPTHFRFPIKTKSDVRASLAIFSRKASHDEYSDSERQLIAARLVTAMELHGIKRNTKIWKYNEEKQILSFSNIEIPVDMLSKVQLKAVIESILGAKTNENNNINDSITNLEEVVMDPQLFTAYVDFVVGYISKAVDEATATAFQAESDAWLTQNVKETAPSETANETSPQTAMSASEQAMADQIKASANEIAKLKSDLQDKDFNEYLASQTNLTPVMANKLKPLLKATSEFDSASKTPLHFAEGDKTIKATATELLKSVIKEIPSAVDFNEKIKAEQKTNNSKVNMKFSEDSQELHSKIMSFIASEKTNGKELTYAEALKLVAGGNL